MAKHDEIKPHFFFLDKDTYKIPKQNPYSAPCPPPNHPPVPFNKPSSPPMSNNDIMSKLIEMEKEMKDIKAMVQKLIEKEQKNN